MLAVTIPQIKIFSRGETGIFSKKVKNLFSNGPNTCLFSPVEKIFPLPLVFSRQFGKIL
jgi:hypothetical protein